MKTNILPIGSVVTVGESELLLMVTSLMPLMQQDGTTYYADYGCVPLPLGLTGQELIFINQDMIDKVHFEGYLTPSHKEVVKQIAGQTIPYPQWTGAQPSDLA